MLRTRIIPILLMRNKGLVKTVKFGEGKYIGDPINAVKIFNDKEVDEIVIMDIDASKENRKPNFNTIKELASECFMPLAYGGGISDLEDVKKLFALGVEKVVINSAALHSLSLITEAAQIFGDQSIILCVDVSKNIWGKYQLHSHKGVSNLPADIVAYVQQAEKAGVGEVILQSVERDGTMSGYDLKLIEKVSKSIDIPLVACGGAGSLSDLKKGFDAGASALAVGSLFVYHGPHKAVLINFPTQVQLKALFN